MNVSNTTPDNDTPAESAPNGAADGQAARQPAAGTAPAAPAPAPGAPAPAQAARAALKQFQEQYAVFRECKPLAIGIDKQLMERVPGLTRRALRMALGIHTSSLRYLKAMEKATVRYDLDDQPREEVTDEHRKHASDTLRERFKKGAEQKRAQEKQARAEREAEEAARVRAEKLNALTAKFAKR